MRRTWVVLGLIMSAGILHGEDKLREQAEQMVRQAYEISVGSVVQHPPYQEDGKFTFYNLVDSNENGIYRRVWADTDNFWWEVRMDAQQYQQLVVKKGGKFYRRESAKFTPVRVTQLHRLFPPFSIRFDETDVIRKIKDRRVGSIPASCIEFDTVKGKNKVSRDICLAKDDSRVLYFRDDESEYLWSDYRPFQGRQLPTHAELKEHGGKIIALDLTYGEAAGLTRDLIVLPAGVEADHVCHTRLIPVLKSAPDPKFPADDSKRNGTVILALLVGKDGTVQDSYVIQSMGKAYDEEAQRVVRRWQFTPAKCDGSPEESKTTVTINFQLR